MGARTGARVALMIGILASLFYICSSLGFCPIIILTLFLASLFYGTYRISKTEDVDGSAYTASDHTNQGPTNLARKTDHQRSNCATISQLSKLLEMAISA